MAVPNLAVYRKEELSAFVLDVVWSSLCSLQIGFLSGGKQFMGSLEFEWACQSSQRK